MPHYPVKQAGCQNDLLWQQTLISFLTKASRELSSTCNRWRSEGNWSLNPDTHKIHLCTSCSFWCLVRTITILLLQPLLISSLMNHATCHWNVTRSRQTHSVGRITKLPDLCFRQRRRRGQNLEEPFLITEMKLRERSRRTCHCVSCGRGHALSSPSRCRVCTVKSACGSLDWANFISKYIHWWQHVERPS